MLLRMAADQERADRIRALKQERPDLTWRRIADFVGVTERSATDWQVKGGISYDNAKRLAELFEVDVDYVWRGPADVPQEATPSPFAGPDALAEALGVVESKLDRVLANQAKLFTLVGEMEQWTELGEQITERLDILEAHVTGRVDESAVRLAESVDHAVEMLRAAGEPADGHGQRPARPRKPAAKRSAQA